VVLHLSHLRHRRLHVSLSLHLQRLGLLLASPLSSSRVLTIARRGLFSVRRQLSNDGGKTCATVLQPVTGSGRSPVMLPCGDPSQTYQTWNLNASFFPGTPNASTGCDFDLTLCSLALLAHIFSLLIVGACSILLPAHADTPGLEYGWTYAKYSGEAPAGDHIVVFEIGTRFHGECTGNFNCQFVVRVFCAFCSRLRTFFSHFAHFSRHVCSLSARSLLLSARCWGHFLFAFGLTFWWHLAQLKGKQIVNYQGNCVASTPYVPPPPKPSGPPPPRKFTSHLLVVGLF
jgi:hypothetical protein